MSTGASEPEQLKTRTPIWNTGPSRAVLSASEAQIRGVVLLVPIALVSLGPYFALWGLPDTAFTTNLTSAVLFVVAFAIGTVLHEVLHGLGHTWGEASWDDIQFGMHWEALTPYAQCRVPARTHSYRVAVALPGLVLGLFPLVVGVASGIWLVTFYGFLMLIAAAGDILVLWILRNVPARAWVQDHPREVGCLVVAGPDASSPDSISEAELTDAASSDRDGLSLRHVVLLVAVSMVFAVVGFLIALA